MKAIEKAKSLAESDYYNREDPKRTYKRVWTRHAMKGKDGVVYALEGTPDKAFVVVINGYAYALRKDMKLLDKFSLGVDTPLESSTLNREKTKLNRRFKQNV